MLEDAIRSWLEGQCQALGIVSDGLVVGRHGGRALAVPWPAGDAVDRDLADAADAALRLGRRVVRSRRAGAQQGEITGTTDLALPLEGQHQRWGAVAIRLIGRRDDSTRFHIKTVSDRLQAGLPQLSACIEAASATAPPCALDDLVLQAVSGEGPDPAAAAVLTALADRLGCQRVALGWPQRGRMRLGAVSHTADFDARSQWASAIEAAMDEAGDQDRVVHLPPRDESEATIRLAHEDLARALETDRVWSVPFAVRGELGGAFCFVAPQGQTPDPEAVAFSERAAHHLGPVLALQRGHAGGGFRRALMRLDAIGERLLGRGHPRFKVSVSIGVLALLLLTFVPGEYRVGADARIEGRVQRAIVAGLDGFVAEARVRAGDRVRGGETMARLDDRDLLVERRNGSGRLIQLEGEYREALAEQDRSRARILKAQMEQVRAEQALLEARLARTRLVAPFDGVVVAGDLSQRLGSPVARGDLLFEVAPLDGFRIILHVDERDIAGLSAGQDGALRLSALPDDPLPFEVHRIQPVTVPADGRNAFRVEAHLRQDEVSEAARRRLRPGMEGTARIDVGSRPLLWILSHDLIDALRLGAWSWW